MSAPKLNLVGPQIRTVRVAKKLSQKDLAARCTVVGFRIEWDTISKIERQVRGLSELEFILIADALRVKVDALVPNNRMKWIKDTRLPHVKKDEEQ